MGVCNRIGDTLWLLADQQGSVRDVADFDETLGVTEIANHIVYDAFGNVTSQTNAAVDVVFGFTGRELDPESDLYFYRARYYDPGLGRFVSEDPIGFAAGDANLNRYVGNDPVSGVDPSGLMRNSRGKYKYITTVSIWSVLGKADVKSILAEKTKSMTGAKFLAKYSYRFRDGLADGVLDYFRMAAAVAPHAWKALTDPVGWYAQLFGRVYGWSKKTFNDANIRRLRRTSGLLFRGYRQPPN